MPSPPCLLNKSLNASSAQSLCQIIYSRLYYIQVGKAGTSLYVLSFVPSCFCFVINWWLLLCSKSYISVADPIWYLRLDYYSNNSLTDNMNWPISKKKTDFLYFYTWKNLLLEPDDNIKDLLHFTYTVYVLMGIFRFSDVLKLFIWDFSIHF